MRYADPVYLMVPMVLDIGEDELRMVFKAVFVFLRISFDLPPFVFLWCLKMWYSRGRHGIYDRHGACRCIRRHGALRVASR